MGPFVHTVYLGIGSNLGDREKNCEKAIKLLKSSSIAKNIIISKWYETKPVLPPPCHSERSEESAGSNFIHEILRPLRAQNDTPPFINGVAYLETELTPRQLLEALHEIESSLGRIRTGEKWEPRTIDIDILFYDDIVLNEHDLKIPHPEAHKRMFVLEPLCDIAPLLIHPVLKRTIREFKEAL